MPTENVLAGARVMLPALVRLLADVKDPMRKAALLADFARVSCGTGGGPCSWRWPSAVCGPGGL
jgi:hypothetical protein